MPFEIKSTTTTTIQYSTVSAKETETVLKNGKKQITYQVKAGDNLYSIAKNYRVKITDLLQWNKLKNGRVKEGDVLKIKLVNSNPI